MLTENVCDVMQLNTRDKKMRLPKHIMMKSDRIQQFHKKNPTEIFYVNFESSVVNKVMDYLSCYKMEIDNMSLILLDVLDIPEFNNAKRLLELIKQMFAKNENKYVFEDSKSKKYQHIAPSKILLNLNKVKKFINFNDTEFLYCIPLINKFLIEEVYGKIYYSVVPVPLCGKHIKVDYYNLMITNMIVNDKEYIIEYAFSYWKKIA